MRFGEQRTNLILTIGALILAVLAGVLIPLASGSQPGSQQPTWVPLPTSSSTPTRLRPTVTVPASPRTSTPTRLPVTPSPSLTLTATATLSAPTASPTPSATATPVQTAVMQPPAAATATASGAPIATIHTGPLNLRSGPGKDYGVLAVGAVGDTFAVVGRSADGAWLKVCCVKDAPVWLAADLVDVTGAIQDVPVVQ